MRKIFFSTWLLLSFIYVGAASAINLEYDFRTAAWNHANGQAIWYVDPITAIAGNSIGGSEELYQDHVDGLGILGGENDEIDKQEWLFVFFDTSVFLRDVFITDLYDPNDGNNTTNGEKGFVELYSGLNVLLATYDFEGINADQANGELLVGFGGGVSGVSYAKFYADTSLSRNNEFSVAGFNSEVPEPATLLLFGTGLAGLAGFSRRRK